MLSTILHLNVIDHEYHLKHLSEVEDYCTIFLKGYKNYNHMLCEFKECISLFTSIILHCAINIHASGSTVLCILYIYFILLINLLFYLT